MTRTRDLLRGRKEMGDRLSGDKCISSVEVGVKNIKGPFEIQEGSRKRLSWTQAYHPLERCVSGGRRM